MERTPVPSEATSAGTGGRPGRPGVPWRRIMVVGLITVALSAGAILLVGPIREEVVDVVSGYGRAAPTAFLVLYVVLTLLMVPSSVLALTAGVLFGAVLGAALTVAGGTVSAAIGFLLGRRFGRGRVERFAGKRLERADRWLDRHGIVAVAVARNVPAVPYGLLNYAAGLTGIPARRFLVGTVLGIVPGGLAFATFGGTLDDLTSPQFALAVALLVVVVLGGAVLEHRLSPARD